MTDKPEYMTEEHLDFLYDLRASGQCNMFGAAPVLQEAFPELDKNQARKVTLWWMDNFDQERAENDDAMSSSRDIEDSEYDDDDEDEDDEL